MEEIAKHINDTNASYRHIGAGVNIGKVIGI